MPTRRFAEISLIVYFLPVSDASDDHCLRRVIDNVDHPVVANPNAPVIPVAFELLTPFGARVICQLKNLPIDSRVEGIVKRIQLPLR